MPLGIHLRKKKHHAAPPPAAPAPSEVAREPVTPPVEAVKMPDMTPIAPPHEAAPGGAKSKTPMVLAIVGGVAVLGFVFRKQIAK